MNFTKILFITFLSLTCFGNPQLSRRIEQLRTKLYTLRASDYKPYNKLECLNISKEMLAHASDLSLDDDLRSDAFLISGAFIGIIPMKIIKSRNIFKFGYAIKLLDKSFSSLKSAIELNDVNELAIILHGKFVYQGFKMKSLIERKLGIDLDYERVLAIEEMERIPYSTDSDRDKYYGKLLAL